MTLLNEALSSPRYLLRPIIAASLLLVTILAASGHLDRFVTFCGLGSINEFSEQYLSDSYDKSLKGFLVLSGLKSGIAVIEGSEVGVGFNLQVGDIVQSIYDYVDVAWRTSLAGCSVLLLMRLTLQTAREMAHWLLFATGAISFALFLSFWFLPRKTQHRRWLKDCLLFVVSLTIAFYLILPLSIAGASHLSDKITRPLIDEAQTGFEKLESDFTPEALNKRLYPRKKEEEKSFWPSIDFKDKIEEGKQAILKMEIWLQGITRDSAVWSIKLIAGYLFDCIVFPLAFFVVVYILTRGLLTYLLGISRSRSMREEFESVIRKYYGSRELGKQTEPGRIRE